MSKNSSGKFADKHPTGTVPDPGIQKALTPRVNNGMISCVSAHSIAEELGVSPTEVGKSIDLLEYRISKCQLGLFGYEPDKKCVKPSESISEELEKSLSASVRQGRLTCIDAWQIADRMGLKKMSVSSACEAMGIKIKPCQLGAF